MGPWGWGRSRSGSVAERFIRKATTDTLVVRNTDPLSVQQGAIVVGLDGSPQAFHGLKVGLALGKALDRPVEAVAVYDPYLHHAMFNGIVRVLPEKAAKIFRVREQEQLHREIIDTGLATIYQSHLDIGRKLAREEGVELRVALLDGKCFERLLGYCRKAEPWLLVLGRTGVHSEADDPDLGANTENLLRQAPTNVLVTAGRFHPPVDVKAEGMIAWTEEARARMERVPAQVRGIARSALLRYAIEQGYSVITSGILDEVLVPLMPTRMACAMIEEDGASEFSWTPEALARLSRVPAGFMRDMTREEIERAARAKGATTIDLALGEEGIAQARNAMNEVLAGRTTQERT